MADVSKDLGELEREYDTNQIGRYFGLIVGIGLIGGGIYLGISAALTSEKIIWILGGFLAIFLVAIGSFFIRRFLKNRGGTILLYQNGLDVTINGKRYIAPWDEIAAVQEIIERNLVNGIHVSDTYSYFVRLKNDDYFLLDQTFFGVKEIGEIICDETYKRLYPQLLQKIRNGEKVVFGNISIDSGGLSANGKTFLWTYLSGFTWEDGEIKLNDQKGKKVWSELYPNIPNGHIFVAILPEFIRKQFED